MSRLGVPLALLALSPALSSACKEPPEPASLSYDAGRSRRLLQPPGGEVRAVPPHLIHADGVGPYVLGATLREVLELLARGPRVVLLQIDDVVDFSLVRAEQDALLIGVEPLGGVAFVSVLDEEIGRTEAGVGVGSTAAELDAALGARLRDPAAARHPSLLVFERLPGVRFVLDAPGGRVLAVVVGSRSSPPASAGAGQDAASGEGEGAAGRFEGAQSAAARAALDAGTLAPVALTPPPDPCAASVDVGERGAELAALGSLDPAAALWTSACFSGDDAELLGYDRGRLAVVAGGNSSSLAPLRRVASHEAPGLVFAAPLDLEGDGRSELAVVTQHEADEIRWLSFELLRLEGAQLVSLGAVEGYHLSERNSRWVGAHLSEITLIPELHARGAAVEFGGLYLHRLPTGIETVVPLVGGELQPRRRRLSPAPAAAEQLDGGLSDAAHEPDGVVLEIPGSVSEPALPRPPADARPTPTPTPTPNDARPGAPPAPGQTVPATGAVPEPAPAPVPAPPATGPRREAAPPSAASRTNPAPPARAPENPDAPAEDEREP